MGIELKEFIPFNVVIILPKTCPRSNQDSDRGVHVRTPMTAVVGELAATWRDGAEDAAEPVQPDPSLQGISAEHQGPLLPGDASW